MGVLRYVTNIPEYNKNALSHDDLLLPLTYHTVLQYLKFSKKKLMSDVKTTLFDIRKTLATIMQLNIIRKEYRLQCFFFFF